MLRHSWSPEVESVCDPVQCRRHIKAERSLNKSLTYLQMGGGASCGGVKPLCVSGFTGEKGNQGVRGVKGSVGVDGNLGDKGDSGAAGPRGESAVLTS